MDILAALNPAQRQAVETVDGPLLILAGPGSGKTRVITHRVAYLVKVCGINPRHIIAVTFTNKAAQEMRERLEQLLGQASQALTLGTFHAICARILRSDGKAMGLDSRFVIYDEDDQLNVVKQVMEELDLEPKQYSPRALRSAISAAKSRLVTPQDHAKLANSYFEEIVQRVYSRYQELLSESRALDFDDLLMKTVQLFKENSQVLGRYQSRYVHILVDEFQDTNTTQYMLIKQLAGKYRNICVVGDPDQSIYSWRFADLRNILNFEKDYSQAKVVFLEQNYRSTKTILEVASAIISASMVRKPKNLWTENEVGSKVVVMENYSEEEEAQSVVSEIEKVIDQDGLSFKDCAVMYRVNAQSRALEETFVRYGVPYKLVGGTRFYQRQEVKDIVAYLRVMQNPQDNVSLTRIINTPPRGIGSRSLGRLQNWARSHNISLCQALREITGEKDFPPSILRALDGFSRLMDDLIAQSGKLSPAELLDEIVECTGYRKFILAKENGEERWENVIELKNVASEYSQLEPEEALAALLEKVSLVAEIDEMDEKADAVTLITLHQAKGLEFPAVFIVGIEEGILPHRRSYNDPGELEEERRLFYVGTTRAQKRLFLSYSHRRSLFGSSAANQPSRFLENIPPDLVRSTSLWEEEYSLPVRDYSPSLPYSPTSTLRVGDHVRHSRFGVGIVMNYTTTRDDQEITVAFEGVGVKKLLASLANLEKMEKDSDFLP